MSDPFIQSALIRLTYTAAMAGIALYLSHKKPLKYWIATLLCLFAPGVGQIYIKSKYRVIIAIFFIVYGNNSAKQDTEAYYAVIILSVLTVLYRTRKAIMLNREETMKASKQSYSQQEYEMMVASQTALEKDGN